MSAPDDDLDDLEDVDGVITTPDAAKELERRGLRPDEVKWKWPANTNTEKRGNRS